MAKPGVYAEKESAFFSLEKREPHQGRYGWVMLSLSWGLYANFGLVSRAIAPLVTPILKDLNLSYTQMGIILGSWQLTFIPIAIVTGAILDRWGIRKTLFTGTLIIAASAVLRFFANNFGTLLVAIALFGMGGPTISIGCPKTISIWFTGRSRGAAVGIYMTGGWIGGLLALTITNSLIMPLMGHSWRLTFAFYGFLALGMAFLWWLFAKEPQMQMAGARENVSLSEVFLSLLRVRNVRFVLLMGILSFATAHGFTTWLPRILETNGLSPVTASLTASIPIAAGIPSVFLFPRLAPPSFRWHLLAFLALFTMVTPFIVVSTSSILLFVALILFGMASFSFLSILILILMDTPEVGPRYMGSAGGLLFCVAEIGGFTGPFIMGTLVDITGTFLSGAVFVGVLNLLMVTLALWPKTQSAASGEYPQDMQKIKGTNSSDHLPS